MGLAIWVLLAANLVPVPRQSSYYYTLDNRQIEVARYGFKLLMVNELESYKMVAPGVYERDLSSEDCDEEYCHSIVRWTVSEQKLRSEHLRWYGKKRTAANTTLHATQTWLSKPHAKPNCRPGVGTYERKGPKTSVRLELDCLGSAELRLGQHDCDASWVGGTRYKFRPWW